MTLDNEATLEIQHLLRDFKPEDGDLLGALHAVQHRYGYIPQIAYRVVARQLRLSEARVYGAATFYSEFRTDATAGDARRVVQRPRLPPQGRRRHPADARVPPRHHVRAEH